MGFEPMHANIVGLESTSLDQLGQSGKKVTLDVRIELTASRLTVGRSDQLS